MVRNQDLPNFYAAADLFVAPSMEARSGDSEGQGVVFLEAFAARLCVLATRSGGIDAVVRDRHSGILVRPNQPQEIAAAIEQLMCNAALRTTLAANAYDEVKERFDWQHIAGEFDKLYREFIPSTGHQN
jgi:glycosyltransferase involved in cell wall biosynthesis